MSAVTASCTGSGVAEGVAAGRGVAVSVGSPAGEVGITPPEKPQAPSSVRAAAHSSAHRRLITAG